MIAHKLDSICGL